MDGGFESFEVEEIRDKRITKRGEKFRVFYLKLI